MSVEIIYLEESLVNKTLHFFNNERSDKLQFNNRQKHEFEWLFLDGYYKKALYVLAVDNESGEILGTDAGIFVPMISPSGKEVRTIKGEDTLISLDKTIKYRNKDLLSEMLKEIERKARSEETMFMWGLTPARSAFKRCGFQISEPVQGSFLVIKPLSFYSLRLKATNPGIKRKIELFAFAWINLLTQKIKNLSKTSCECKELKINEIDFSKLVQLSPENSYSLFLGEEFIKWRILRNPSNIKYGFLEFIVDKNSTAAFLVYSENNDRVFYLEYLLFAPFLDDDGKLAVIKSARNKFAGEGAVMIRANGFSHNKANLNEMKILKRAGFYFFSNKNPSYFIFKNISDTPINLEDIYVSRLNTQGVI